MSVFENAFAFMIQNEDATQAYKIVPDAPLGAFAISGINSFAFPNQYSLIAAIPQSQRGPAVKQFYQTTFWNHWLEAIVSDDVVMRVFDASVNMGTGTGNKLLQTAINSVKGGCIEVDGELGTNTVNAANLCDSALLVLAFKNARCQHYQDIVAKNPSDQQYLNEWLLRAKK